MSFGSKTEGLCHSVVLQHLYLLVSVSLGKAAPKKRFFCSVMYQFPEVRNNSKEKDIVRATFALT